MATERVTSGDIRAAAKVFGGLPMGVWTPGDPNNPLAEPLQEMADDIAKWLNPNQGWHLAEVFTGFPSFHFTAERPPIKTKGLIRRSEVFNFPQVFTPDFRDRVKIWGEGNADVHAAHIGQVYPLEKALKEVSSPYFLVGATISVNSRQRVPGTVFEPRQEREVNIKPELPKELIVTVYMRDLMNQIRLEVNRLRRIQRELDKKFPQLQSIQEAVPQP